MQSEHDQSLIGNVDLFVAHHKGHIDEQAQLTSTPDGSRALSDL